MKKGEHIKPKPPKRGKVSILTHAKTKKGAEIWRVSHSGKFVTVKTSKSSAEVMDEAVKVYSKALKRLAKR